MFGLGTVEMIVIGTVAFLLFGSRLPKAMFNIGKSFVQLRRGFEAPIEEEKDRKDT